MLYESVVHFSDPSVFNDPLDCSPSVIVDIGLEDLENLYCKMVGEEQARKNLNGFRYYENEDDTHGVTDECYQSDIADGIRHRLDVEMKHGRGVLSLAGNWNSPLMWSHYADEHRGICIEYDVSLSVCEPPKKIDYKGDRGILASEIKKWVFDNSISAKEMIEQKYFYTKANQWEYEEEWRYVKHVKLDEERIQSTPFRITGIYFGMRCCERSVIPSIVRLMRDSTPKLSFYHVSPNSNSFELVRTEIDDIKLDGCYKPRPSASMIFGKPVKRA